MQHPCSDLPGLARIIFALMLGNDMHRECPRAGSLVEVAGVGISAGWVIAIMHLILRVSGRLCLLSCCHAHLSHLPCPF